MARAWLLVLGVALLPSALAHGGEHGLEEQLLEDGERLMVGGFRAPQPGALLVLPVRDGPLDCAGAGAPIRIGMGGGSLRLALNATHLVASFDVAGNATGFAAFAVDTAAAVRSLILMQEHAIALHALGAAVANESGAFVRTGAMGVPYALPVESPHKMEHALEGGGVQIAYERASAVEACGNGTALRFDRANLTSMGAGAIVHAVALLDPELPFFLPRPIDETTDVMQLNLYLARPGEDPAAVARALDPSPGAHEVVPALVLAMGLGAMALPLARGRVEGGEEERDETI